MAGKELSGDYDWVSEKIFWNLVQDEKIEGGGVMNLLKEIRDWSKLFKINYKVDLINGIATFEKFGNVFSRPITHQKLENEEYIQRFMKELDYVFFN